MKKTKPKVEINNLGKYGHQLGKPQPKQIVIGEYELPKKGKVIVDVSKDGKKIRLIIEVME